MDLQAFLLELVAPLAPGDEALPGVRLLGASSELGMRIAFARGDERVNVEVWPVEEQERFAARSPQLAFSYRSSATTPTDGELAMRLCRLVAERAADNEGRALEALRDAHRGEQGAGRIRHVTVSRLLEEAGPPHQRHYTLSTYVGCLIGCRFCYAQSRLASVRSWLGLPEVPWGSYVDVRTNAAEVLDGELESLPRRPLKFCPIVSDPYQAVEKTERVTRQCLEAIAAHPGWVPFVLTRSALVTRDVDVLERMEDCRVGFSLPTLDDEVRRHFEPRGARVADRLGALRALREAGVRTFAIVQPLLPGSLDGLADSLAGAVESVSIDVLRGVQGAAGDFDDPRFRHCADDAWQRARATELRDLLEARGVTVWSGELPPDLSG